MRSGATKSVLNAFADSDRFHPPKSLGEIVAGCDPQCARLTHAGIRTESLCTKIVKMSVFKV